MATALLDELEHLDSRGLVSPAAEVARLRLLLLNLDTDKERFAFDNAMTSVTTSAVRQILLGQLRPVERADSTSAMQDTLLISHLVRQLSLSPFPVAVLDAAEPRYPEFHRLRAAWLLIRNKPEDIRQARTLALAMERWRWLPQQSEGTSLVVNIPSYELTAYQRDADTLMTSLSMAVAVGTSGLHPTLVFSDSVRMIVFAPVWNVPASITKGELLPIAERDPYILTLNGYQIVNRVGRVLPATATSVALVRRGSAFIRQLPGGTNALGRVKFLFPNAHDIYLHDTPRRGDFDLARRDLSHGCVRLADPEALAKFLLAPAPEWSVERIQSAMKQTTASPVTLGQPIPVHLVYITATVTPEGRVLLYDDVYHFDEALLQQWLHLRHP